MDCRVDTGGAAATENVLVRRSFTRGELKKVMGSPGARNVHKDQARRHFGHANLVEDRKDPVEYPFDYVIREGQ